MSASLLLIDLSAVFWWKWHASAGQSIDAAHDYAVGKVRSLAASEYTHVIVCCDAGLSFRYDIDPQYKANRPPRDEAAVAQLKRVKDSLYEAGFSVVGVSGYEADDTIATLTEWAKAQGHLVTIAGSDKDLYQLVGDRVRFYAITTDLILGPAGVKEKIGVEPHQVRDFLALVGDAADNVKGVPRVGAKTAARLLAEFGDRMGIVAAMVEDDKITPPSILAALRENQAALDLSTKLVTLDCSVPIDCAAAFEAARIDRDEYDREDIDEYQEPEEMTTNTQANGTAAAPATTAQRPPAAKASRFTAAAVSTAPDNSADRFILTGRSGIGKTYMLSRIPGIFMIPVEEGLKGIAPGYNPARYREPGPDGEQRDIVPKSLGELGQMLDGFMGLNLPPEPGQPRPYRHLGIDSLTGVETLVHMAALNAEKVPHMEAKEFQRMWHAAEPLWRRVQERLDAIRHTGVHVWIIAHSSEVIDAASTTGDVYRKWDLLMKGAGKVGETVRNMWRAWADHVFFMDWVVKVQKGDKSKRSVGKYEGRILYTRESATHYAKNRANLPVSVPATYEDLAKAIKVGRAEGNKSAEPKLRAQIADVMKKLDEEDRKEIENDLAGAGNVHRLAAILSRAQGMLAVAQEDAMPDDETTTEETATAAE